MQPKVSVIIPMYNMELYICECLDSVIRQTMEDIEILIVDDGSTDSSLQICQKYADKDNRIQLLKKENGGVTSARNLALDKANGEFVLFVDSDDWLEYNACELLVHQQLINNADMVVGDICEVRNGVKKHIQMFNRSFSTDEITMIHTYQKICLGYCYNPYQKQNRSVSGYGSIGNKIFRRSIIEKKNIRFDPYVNEIYEDNLFTLHFLNDATRISYIPKEIYNYRQISNSSSHRFKNDSLETSRHIFQRIEEFIAMQDEPDEFLLPYYVYIIRRLSTELRVYFFSEDSEKRLKDSFKELIDTIHSEPYKTAICEVEDKKLMAPHRLTCLTARTNSAIIMYLGYILRKNVKKWCK